MLLFTENELSRLEKAKEKYCLKNASFAAKGFSSLVFKAEMKGRLIALKIERSKSRRNEMLEKEVRHLRKANAIGIGPKLCFFDGQLKAIGMQFIEGTTFNEFMHSKPKEKELIKAIKQLLLQAKKLDSIGLSHGQLAGKMKNILITRKSRPIIIDFEKASENRKARNLNQLKAALFFNPHSGIAKMIRETLNEKELEKLKAI